MRYLDWDVLLFPPDSRVPIQEFKTACFAVIDSEVTDSDRDGDRQMPILTTFVPSHASGVPLKVSIHRWAAPSFTDDALQRSKQVGSTLYHEARITIDGTLVASAILECPYPYIIDTQTTETGSQDTLRWPVFRSEQLDHEYWSAGENMGRIKVIIAEGYAQSGEKSRFVRTKSVVAFAFQHAPQEILETYGIAWPNKDMWIQEGTSGLLSPYRSEQAPNADLHSHSPLRLLNLPHVTQEQMLTSYAAQESLHPLMPRPSLLPHFQQRHDAWGNGGFPGDPFVDTKAGQRSGVSEIPTISYSSVDEKDALQSLTRMKSGSLGDYFPSPLTLTGMWDSPVLGTVAQGTGEIGKHGSTSTTLGHSTGPSAMDLDQVLNEHSYAPHSQQRAAGLSIPRSRAPELVSVDNVPTPHLSPELVLKSTEVDDRLKENSSKSRPGTRHGLRSRSSNQSIGSESEVLGELQANQMPQESTEGRKGPKSRAPKISTEGRAAAEKRKRPSMSNGRSRRNPSTNSTPSSARKISDKPEGMESLATILQ